MSYRLWINKDAKVELKRLPGNMRQRLRRAINDLSENPRPHYSRKMRTPDDLLIEGRRIRLERWRLVYVIDDQWEEIGILAVRRRPPYNYGDLPDLLAELDD